MGRDGPFEIAVARSDEVIVIGRSGAGPDTNNLRDVLVRTRSPKRSMPVSKRPAGRSRPS